MDIYFIRYKLEDKVDSTLINLDRETIIRDNLFAFKNAVSKQNKDILERFYKEHQELYNYISNLLSNIKVKRKEKR